MFKTLKKGFFPFLIGFSALSVSASAAFYSVYGLSKLFAGAQLEVIMSADGKWKLHLPHKYRKVKKYGKDGGYGKYTREKIELSLKRNKKSMHHHEGEIFLAPSCHITNVTERMIF